MLRDDMTRTWDHLEDASGNLKYLKNPLDGWIGPHLSSCTHLKNLGDSMLIFIGDGQVISLPWK